MNRLKKNFAFVWAVALSLVAVSCSDDDSPTAPSISKLISSATVYQQMNDGSYGFHSRYEFSYDSSSRISEVSPSFGDQEIDYEYGKDEFSYEWTGTDTDGNDFVNRFKAKINAGRVDMGTSTKQGNYTYFYTSKGYVSQTSVGGDRSIVYTWGAETLELDATPAMYDTEYTYSTVENNYAFDLNALLQLLDGREGFVEMTNSYAQLADMLGARYPYLLEDIDFGYSYMFDDKGRLAQINRKSVGNAPDKQASLWIQFKYKD